MKKVFFLVLVVAVLLCSVLGVVLAVSVSDVQAVATSVNPAVQAVGVFNPALSQVIDSLLLAGILIFQALKYFFPKM